MDDLIIYRAFQAIDSEGEVFSIFPISKRDALVKLTGEDKESFKILVGDLFAFYTVLDTAGNVLSEPDYEMDEEE